MSLGALDVIGQPLTGVRVLSMEQAVALPMTTLHMAALGAEIIRVESPTRARGNFVDQDLVRSKSRLAIDLSVEGGPDLFRQFAQEVDIVAHNYTPRVMRKFGIDYEAIKDVKEDIIYLSITGFGTTGPWADRPLFGPGAEAIAGNYQLIGEPDEWPGRPGTIVYADNNCGMHALLGIIAALERRDDSGVGTYLDVSLYETAISMLGPVIAQRAAGGQLPWRLGNKDSNYAVHEVFAADGLDRWIAISVTEEQRSVFAVELNMDPEEIDSHEQLVRKIQALDAKKLSDALLSKGISAYPVSDMSDIVSSDFYWNRNHFGFMHDGHKLLPTKSTFWGGRDGFQPQNARDVGADNRELCSGLLGHTPEKIDELENRGILASGMRAVIRSRTDAATNEVRIERGELTRVDDQPSQSWLNLAKKGERRL